MVNKAVQEARDSQNYYLALKTDRFVMGHEAVDAQEHFAVRAGAALLPEEQNRETLRAAGQAAIDALGK